MLRQIGRRYKRGQNYYNPTQVPLGVLRVKGLAGYGPLYSALSQTVYFSRSLRVPRPWSLFLVWTLAGMVCQPKVCAVSLCVLK